jgi:CHAT domain-containing protein
MLNWPVNEQQSNQRVGSRAAKPGVDRTEAHRRAMMTFIDDTDHPHYAHPLFWAPYVVVGERGSALH